MGVPLGDAHQTQTSLVHRGDYGWKPITSSDPETLKKKPLDFVEHVGLVEGYSVIVHAEHQPLHS